MMLILNGKKVSENPRKIQTETLLSGDTLLDWKVSM
jgi:hypothetical protein